MKFSTEHGYLEGYPDGFFDSSRTLTWYEFAQGIYMYRDSLEVVHEEEDGIAVFHVSELLVEALSYEFAKELSELCIFPNKLTN